MVILTDLSEVLIRGFYGTEKIVGNRYSKKVGERFWQRHLDTNDRFQDLLRGRMLEDEYWYYFLDTNEKWPFGVEEVESMFSENMHQLLDGGDALTVYQRIIRYPKWLSGPKLMAKRTPDIYIVSDHIAERLDEIKEAHPRVFSAVKRQFWSCELGKIKQDPDFFPTLLEITGLKPDEAIFIDDSIENVISAGKSGINGICYHGPDQLAKSLARHGFVIAP